MKNILLKNIVVSSPKVIIINKIEDVDNAIDLLRERQPIIVNASNISRREGLRIIDFLSGYCYAENGKYKRIDEMIYRFEI